MAEPKIDEQREDEYIAQIKRVRAKIVENVGAHPNQALVIATEVVKEVAADRRQDRIDKRMERRG